MEILWEELTSGLPDTRQLVHVMIRLIAATLLGAVVGIERERARKPAGLRTHTSQPRDHRFRVDGLRRRDVFR